MRLLRLQQFGDASREEITHSIVYVTGAYVRNSLPLPSASGENKQEATEKYLSKILNGHISCGVLPTRKPHTIVCARRVRASGTRQHETRGVRHTRGRKVRGISVLGPYVRDRDN